MNGVEEISARTPKTAVDSWQSSQPENETPVSKSSVPLRTLLAVPIASAVALAVHLTITQRNPPAMDASSARDLVPWIESHAYLLLLGALLVAFVCAGVAQRVSGGLRRWMAHMSPIIAGAVVLLCIWELITSGFRLLPMPYFPSPAGVLQSLIDDRWMILDSTWHSLQLLLGGYAVGVLLGLITGVCIGWFEHARYWGMPVLKVIGPIPATAWIPLAMVISPNAMFSAIGLIALAVWFPVTMLTASGISNTRASYLDVARTLGAGRAYLIFRVAIPAAMPNIFIGLFMGLGASFLTLVVAETVGVKSGLGWYLQWAQGWAEYGKVYAALVVMAAFFSTIMTLLFKVRDRVLVWQKGTIRW